jgi:HEPN domain-containing protein
VDSLPDLAGVFFDVDGLDGDHAADSCCLSLAWEWFTDDAVKWAEVRDQHLQALGILAEQARSICSERDGWWLARPLVFAAHHTIELALKTATLSESDRWGSRHDLGLLLELERGICGKRATAEWEDELIRLLHQSWEGGRYPTTRRGEPLLNDWCCVSASGLREAVTTFVGLVASG